MTPSPDSFADISISEEMRLTQQHFLRQKGLMSDQEHVVAFYNNALVSPTARDKTNTCIFVTEERVVQIKDSRLDVERRLDELSNVEVEHNSIFQDDYLLLFPKHGLDIAKMEVVRESVGNSFKQLINQMIDRGRVFLLELQQSQDD